jgi:hypothetical protein
MGILSGPGIELPTNLQNQDTIAQPTMHDQSGAGGGDIRKNTPTTGAPLAASAELSACEVSPERDSPPSEETAKEPAQQSGVAGAAKDGIRNPDAKRNNAGMVCDGEKLRQSEPPLEVVQEEVDPPIPEAVGLSRQMPLVLPGAFRVNPSGRDSSESAPETYEDEGQIEIRPPTVAANNSVVLDATLVSQEVVDYRDIQRATEVDPALDKTRVLRRRAAAFVALAALVCLIGVVTGVVVSSRNSRISPEYEFISFEEFRVTRLPKDSLQRSAVDPQSPQARALVWLDRSLDGSTLVAWRVLQRYALAVLYFSLNGAGWLYSTDWLTNLNECDWKAQSADPSCNLYGRYVSLSLSVNNVTGSLPPEIGLLTALEILELNTNEVAGSIPTSISYLSRLRELWLDSNGLVGSIPTEVGQLQHLTGLYMRENKLSGSIPTEIGELTQLTYLAMSKNMLTGRIPQQIGLLGNTEHLELDRNSFNGTIPSTFSAMRRLKRVLLNDNQVSGSIPTEIALLPDVELFSVENTLITGTIPSQLGFMPLLRTLYLAGSSISGTIPSEL